MEPSSLPWGKNWQVGGTVDHLGITKASPFTQESLNEFKQLYNKIKQGKPQKTGQLTITSKVTENVLDQTKSMGFNAEFQASVYVPLSLHASVEFMKKNTQSSLDVAVVIKAEHSGKKYVCDQHSILKLKKPAINYLKKKGVVAFATYFGRFLIIGEEQGGQIVVNSRYSCMKKSDTKNFSAKLGAKLMFCEFGASVSGKYDNEKSSQLQTSDTTYIINPSTQDHKWADLIKNLKSVSSSTNECNVKYSKFYGQAQRLLSEHSDTSHAIVLRLDKLSCISDVLIEQAMENDEELPDFDHLPVYSFLKFCNNLYFVAISMEKTLEDVLSKWENRQNYEEQIINKWQNTIAWLLGGLRNMNVKQLDDKSYVFDHIRKNGNKSRYQPKEDERWYGINPQELQKKFEQEILQPYEKYAPKHSYTKNQLNTKNIKNPTKMILHIIQGIGLKNLDSGFFGDLSDPFVKVIVSIGGNILNRRTKVWYDNLNPYFDTKFTFPDYDHFKHLDSIQIEVWDHDKIKKDDFIGGIMIWNPTIENKVKTMELKNKNGHFDNCGKIKFELTFA